MRLRIAVGALLYPGLTTGSSGGYDTGVRGPADVDPGPTASPTPWRYWRPSPPTLASTPRRPLPVKASQNHDDTPLPIDRIAADRDGSPEQRPPSLLKPLGRSKEVRQRDSQECHGPSAALFPALSVIPSYDRADTQAPPQRQWPIQGRVTDISALCNANRFLGLVSPWRTTVWGLGTEPGITDCTPGPDQGRCART